MNAHISLLLVVIIVNVAQDVPIPRRPPRGFVYRGGSSNGQGETCFAPVELAVFVDLLCPDSTDAWPALMEVRFAGQRWSFCITSVFSYKTQYVSSV